MNRDFEVLQHVQDPFERLKAMGRAYVGFAIKNPDFYELMFIKSDPMNSLEKPELWKVGSVSFDNLVTVVKACQAQGRFKDMEPIQLSFLVWSCVHGISSLHCCKRMEFIQELDNEKLMEQSLLYFNEFLSRI